ncbi:MAG TPA: hypothetical protein VGM77_10115 [Gemmatimonadales bacterium]
MIPRDSQVVVTTRNQASVVVELVPRGVAHVPRPIHLAPRHVREMPRVAQLASRLVELE